MEPHISAFDESVIESLLRALERRLRRAFPSTDATLVHDGAVDALLDYRQRPERFDPGRGLSLAAYLYCCAWRNVDDLVRARARRLARERDFARLSTVTALRNGHTRGVDVHWLPGVLHDARVTPTEADAIRAWLLEGSRSEYLAVILGCHQQTLSEQRRSVKQFKDRMIKRLRRAVQQGRQEKSRG
jgi:hypothetical protein